MTRARALATLLLALATACGDKDATDGGDGGDAGSGSGDPALDCEFVDCDADYPVIFDADDVDECAAGFECIPEVELTLPAECGEESTVCFTHCSTADWYAECAWDDDCEAACAHIYDEDSCHIQAPGQTQDELRSRCFSECIRAAKVEGEAGDYTPTELASSSQSVRLENRAQVRLWLECLDLKTCEELDEGYCAPIW